LLLTSVVLGSSSLLMILCACHLGSTNVWALGNFIVFFAMAFTGIITTNVAHSSRSDGTSHQHSSWVRVCIPGNQIIVIEPMSTHAQFFTSSTTKKWQQALKPMSLTHEVISPVYFRLAFDKLILIAVPITTDYCC